VNLTWEIEDQHAENRINGEQQVDNATPIGFVVHYCEIQSWGEMQRCNSRLLTDDDCVEYEK
jgi:hypothetical protein